MKKYEEEIIKEICKECNFAGRVIVRLFRKIFIKVYNISRVYTINYTLK